MGTRWRRDALSDHAYLSITGDQAALRREQDTAAGGRPQRRLVLADARSALGRVRLVKRRRARRVYAVLIWHDYGRHELLLGEVAESNRLANLRKGWELVHLNGLADPANRRSWSDRTRPP